MCVCVGTCISEFIYFVPWWMCFLLIFMSFLWLYWQDDVVKLEVHIERHSVEMNTLHTKIDELQLHNDSSDKLLKKLIRDNQVRIMTGQMNIWMIQWTNIQINCTCYIRLVIHQISTKKIPPPNNNKLSEHFGISNSNAQKKNKIKIFETSF